jgi:hypothetical protein
MLLRQRHKDHTWPWLSSPYLTLQARLTQLSSAEAKSKEDEKAEEDIVTSVRACCLRAHR